jgi:hypothetical protein
VAIKTSKNFFIEFSFKKLVAIFCCEQASIYYFQANVKLFHYQIGCLLGGIGTGQQIGNLGARSDQGIHSVVGYDTHGGQHSVVSNLPHFCHYGLTA